MRRTGTNRPMRVASWLVVATTCALPLSCATLWSDAGDGQLFASPAAAGNALVAALERRDEDALERILGHGSKALLTSGDPVMDQNQHELFVRKYEAQHAWITWADGVAVLEIGHDAWPFPIPLVEEKIDWLGHESGWRFDTPEGAGELLNRRIGRNELHTIQACLAFVDAEREYYQRNPPQRAVREYARFILSSPGEKDGLYWPTSADETPSPIGTLYAAAQDAGYSPTQGGGKPYEGYFYRVLHAQGPNAPGGAYDYIEDGAMTGGFALIASPASYGASGIMTFLVNQLGLVYEKDLGAEIAGAIETFDPDDSWAPVPADALALPDR